MIRSFQIWRLILIYRLLVSSGYFSFSERTPRQPPTLLTPSHRQRRQEVIYDFQATYHIHFAVSEEPCFCCNAP